ncbi:MAG: cardiolipin synthase [Treponema sp.]|nr:cardiolipin synthase [Treponema sp.]MCL2237069.1 cardiolipin synthase [Treponema sp.]
MSKKRFKNRIRFAFRRRLLIVLVLLAQIALFFFLIAGTGILLEYSYRILMVLSVIVSIIIINKHEKAGYKLTWIFLILLFPLFGGILYIVLNIWSNPKKLRMALFKNIHDSREAFYLPGNRLDELVQTYPEYKTHAHYLQECAGFPVYGNTRQEYFPSGESYYYRVLEEMEKAQKYIFLEFFIIKEGLMLNSIMTILERKAAAGLDIRIMYDDMGCFFTLPSNFQKTLKLKGIKTFVFNKFRPIVSSLQNNRDHRKIISVDGKVAFTGGLNIGDEYINAVERFGHWKDSAIMIEGDAAWSLTLIFLQMWNLGFKEKDNYAQFYPHRDNLIEYTAEGVAEGYEEWGYVQPYGDTPIDKENVGEHVYIQIINQAKKYVYINTPYLVCDDNLLSALTLAAKSGVDVRIITPHRWDKWIVAITSRSYYRRLIQAGVKVYEYTSGFNHGKTFVADDNIATVGTTNLDFRSLYLHFECGVLIYSSKTIAAVKEDFLGTLPASQLITLKDCSRNAVQRVIQDALRVFAPLM